MSYCVLIPSYNEEKTIGWLVKSLREKNLDVVVVDDGSQDKTVDRARQNGAEVIRQSKNMGKGVALRRAFRDLAERSYQAIIVMDADGQHLPQDLGRFIALFEKEKPGIIVGDRMLRPKGMPLIRWMTNRIMSWVLSVMCRQRIPDSQCGFRLIDMGLLKRMALSTEKFEIESEMLLEAARLHTKIKSVVITTIYSGQFSAIDPFKDTVRFFKFLFRTRKREEVHKND